MNISKYAKAWTALTAGGLAWGAQVVASTSSSITGAEWLGAAGIVVAALGVFFMPNTNVPAPPA
jgi:hypothetical protein